METNTSAYPLRLTGEAPIYRDFAEPSDGLEPSTPSLPWGFGSVTCVRFRRSASHLSLLRHDFGTHSTSRQITDDDPLACQERVTRGYGQPLVEALGSIFPAPIRAVRPCPRYEERTIRLVR